MAFTSEQRTFCVMEFAECNSVVTAEHVILHEYRTESFSLQYRVPKKSLTISEKKHFISNEMFIMWKKTPKFNEIIAIRHDCPPYPSRVAISSRCV